MRHFIMVPQELYTNLLNSNSTDYSRNLADSTLTNQKLDISAKNALYNQRLSGYLKQKKVEEEKPIKVALNDNQLALMHTTNPSPIASKKIKNTIKKEKDLPASPSILKTPNQELENKLIDIIENNKKEFQVTSTGKIKDQDDDIINNSDYSKSIYDIGAGRLRNDKPGTRILFDRLYKNNKTKELIEQMTHLNSPSRTKNRKSRRSNKLDIDIWE